MSRRNRGSLTETLHVLFIGREVGRQAFYGTGEMFDAIIDAGVIF